ncbi:acyltransferase [Sedimentitalea sp. JM2-8]|uniref:Acyltransferase n=1 Tax=Sedimentitalea xiamensis TaxID=3050037 RepID=A0ABT7FHQ5_9RHOB|nr:acyltransferase [Sedimentitalea xiamensis]MDK3074525.1 acyltransferase [Sedimentitalea xiamensis]
MGRQGVFIGDRAAGRDNHFNLIRMVAASGVLVSHAYPIALGPDAVQPLQIWLQGIALGTVCVYVFFAISGFFIAKSFDRSPSLGRFLRARVLRLYPALAVVLALTVLVAGLFLTTAPAATFRAAVPDYMLRNLSLFRLQYDLPGVFETNPYGPPINGSLWTLIHEAMCYAGVFLAGVLGLLRAKRPLALLLAGFVILRYLAPSLPLPGKLLAFLDLAFPFAIGTAFYVWRDRVPLRLSLALGLAALAALSHPTPLFHMVFALALTYWVFLIGLARAPRLLAYNRLGDYSYGTYIYAFPMQQLMAFWGVTLPLANMALAFPATLALAMLSWHLIEKPALALVRRPDRQERRT